MQSSILITTKKLIGIDEGYSHFDTDMIIHINSALSILTGVGVGPEEGYAILDSSETWEEFVPNAEPVLLNLLKTFVYLRTKLIFDPQMSSIVSTSLDEQSKEILWRISTTVD